MALWKTTHHLVVLKVTRPSDPRFVVRRTRSSPVERVSESLSAFDSPPVATEHGALVSCSGGSYQTEDGRPAIKALSWRQVAGIRKRFESLNPYDRKAVPGSILKLEDDNYEKGDPKTQERRQLYCLAISAKRYVLFEKDRAGKPVLLRDDVNNHADRWSEHGLGHLLNPTDPESDHREWIAQVWLNMVRRALGVRTFQLSSRMPRLSEG